MKGLIYNDICTILRMTRYILILAPVLLFAMITVTALGLGADPELYMLPVGLYMAINIGMFLVPSSYCENSGWTKQAFIMPVSRLDCYNSRILTHLLCTGCTAVMGIAVSLISALIFGDCTAFVVGLVFGAAGGMFLFSMIIGICCNALIIRLGLRKASLVFMCAFLLFQFACLFGMLDTLLSSRSLVDWFVILAIIAAGTTVFLYFKGRKWIEQKEL